MLLYSAPTGIHELRVEVIRELRDARGDLVELDPLLAAIALQDVHAGGVDACLALLLGFPSAFIGFRRAGKAGSSSEFRRAEFEICRPGGLGYSRAWLQPRGGAALEACLPASLVAGMPPGRSSGDVPWAGSPTTPGPNPCPARAGAPMPVSRPAGLRLRLGKFSLLLHWKDLYADRTL